MAKTSPKVPRAPADVFKLLGLTNQTKIFSNYNYIS